MLLLPYGLLFELTLEDTLVYFFVLLLPVVVVLVLICLLDFGVLGILLLLIRGGEILLRDLPYFNDGDDKFSIIGGFVVQNGDDTFSIPYSVHHAKKINLEQVIESGDRAKDHHMLPKAGLVISFHAKDVVEQNAKQQMSHGPMTSILYFLGIPGS